MRGNDDEAVTDWKPGDQGPPIKKSVRFRTFFKGFLQHNTL